MPQLPALRGLHALGWIAIGLVLLAILVPMVALTFSVQVVGSSMSPTLIEGDRLITDILDRDSVERFDLVEAQPGDGERRVVKRVIGLPGDRISVARPDADGPRVLIRPAGAEVQYRVANPAWPDQVGDDLQPCCTEDGRNAPRRTEVTVPDGSYWVVGDNWGGSDDSRVFGFVDEAAIGATLTLRILPLSRFGTVENEVRLVEVDRP